MTVAEVTIIGRHAVGVDEQGRLVKRFHGRWVLLRTGPTRDRRPYYRARYQTRKLREAAHA